ncbi:MAG: HD domain-containing phosphohydrolase [Candidatus Omnitrophota bacterium]
MRIRIPQSELERIKLTFAIGTLSLVLLSGGAVYYVFHNASPVVEPGTSTAVAPVRVLTPFDLEALQGNLTAIDTENIQNEQMQRIIRHYLDTIVFLRDSEATLYPNASEKERAERIQHLAFAAIYLTYLENPTFEPYQKKKGPAAGPFQIEAQSAVDVFREAMLAPEDSSVRQLIEKNWTPGVDAFYKALRAATYNNLNTKEMRTIRESIALDPTLQHLLWRLFIYIRMEPTAQDVAGRPGEKDGWPRFHGKYNTPYLGDTAKPRNEGEEANLHFGLATYLKAIAVKTFAAQLVEQTMGEALSESYRQHTVTLFKNLTVDLYQVENVNAPLTNALRRIRDAEALADKIKGEKLEEKLKEKIPLNERDRKRFQGERKRLSINLKNLTDLERKYLGDARRKLEKLNAYSPKGYTTAEWEIIKREAAGAVRDAEDAVERLTPELAQYARQLDPILKAAPKTVKPSPQKAKIGKQRSEMRNFLLGNPGLSLGDVAVHMALPRSEVRTGVMTQGVTGSWRDFWKTKTEGTEQLLDYLREHPEVAHLEKFLFITGDLDKAGAQNLALGGKAIVGVLSLLKSVDHLFPPNESPFFKLREEWFKLLEKYKAKVFRGSGGDEFMILANEKFGQEELKSVIREFTLAFRERYAVLVVDETKTLSVSETLRLKEDPLVLSAAHYAGGTYILVDRQKLSGEGAWSGFLQKIHTELGLEGDQLSGVQFETPERGFFSVSIGAVPAGKTLKYLQDVMKNVKDEDGGDYWTFMKDGVETLRPNRMGLFALWSMRLANDALSEAKNKGRNQAAVGLFVKTAVTPAKVEKEAKKIEERKFRSEKNDPEIVDTLTGFLTETAGQAAVREKEAAIDGMSHLTVQGYTEGKTVERAFHEFQSEIGYDRGDETITAVSGIARELFGIKDGETVQEMLGKGTILFRVAPDGMVAAFHQDAQRNRGPPTVETLDSLALELKGRLSEIPGVPKTTSPRLLLINVQKEHLTPLFKINSIMSMTAWLSEVVKAVSPEDLEKAMDVERGKYSQILTFKPAKAEALLSLYHKAQREKARQALEELGGRRVPYSVLIAGRSEMREESPLMSFENAIKDLQAKDPELYEHSVRVRDLSLLIAKQMGLSPADATILSDAAMFHDLGKIVVPDSILQKPRALEFSEKTVMDLHPQTGAALVPTGVPYREIVQKIVEMHHAENHVNRLTSIVTVADYFDARTSERPYHAPSTPQEVIAALRQDPAKFDPKVVNALEEIVSPGEGEPRSEMRGELFRDVSSEDRPFLEEIQNYQITGEDAARYGLQYEEGRDDDAPTPLHSFSIVRMDSPGEEERVGEIQISPSGDHYGIPPVFNLHWIGLDVGDRGNHFTEEFLKKMAEGTVMTITDIINPMTLVVMVERAFEELDRRGGEAGQEVLGKYRAFRERLPVLRKKAETSANIPTSGILSFFSEYRSEKFLPFLLDYQKLQQVASESEEKKTELSSLRELFKGTVFDRANEQGGFVTEFVYIKEEMGYDPDKSNLVLNVMATKKKPAAAVPETSEGERRSEAREELSSEASGNVIENTKLAIKQVQEFRRTVHEQKDLESKLKTVIPHLVVGGKLFGQPEGGWLDVTRGVGPIKRHMAQPAAHVQWALAWAARLELFYIIYDEGIVEAEKARRIELARKVAGSLENPRMYVFEVDQMADGKYVYWEERYRIMSMQELENISKTGIMTGTAVQTNYRATGKFPASWEERIEASQFSEQIGELGPMLIFRVPSILQQEQAGGMSASGPGFPYTGAELLSDDYFEMIRGQDPRRAEIMERLQNNYGLFILDARYIRVEESKKLNRRRADQTLAHHISDEDANQIDRYLDAILEYQSRQSSEEMPPAESGTGMTTPIRSETRAEARESVGSTQARAKTQITEAEKDVAAVIREGLKNGERVTLEGTSFVALHKIANDIGVGVDDLSPEMQVTLILTRGLVPLATEESVEAAVHILAQIATLVDNADLSRKLQKAVPNSTVPMSDAGGKPARLLESGFADVPSARQFLRELFVAYLLNPNAEFKVLALGGAVSADQLSDLIRAIAVEFKKPGFASKMIKNVMVSNMSSPKAQREREVRKFLNGYVVSGTDAAFDLLGFEFDGVNALRLWEDKDFASDPRVWSAVVKAAQSINQRGLVNSDANIALLKQVAESGQKPGFFVIGKRIVINAESLSALKNISALYVAFRQILKAA